MCEREGGHGGREDERERESWHLSVLPASACHGVQCATVCVVWVNVTVCLCATVRAGGPAAAARVLPQA